MALPRELIDEVLCRLPVKPLLRCRCVSKGWCSLIDSTAFINKHLKTTLECNIGGGLIINGGDKKFYLADFDSLDDASASVVEFNDPLKTLLTDAHYVGASNGIICVFKNQMNDVFLVNPSTRKFRKIASAPVEFPTSFHKFERYLCGFGYDSVNNDFKVVKIAECYLQFRGIMAIVYSLKTNAWTRITNIPSNIRLIGDRGLFASGSLHWTAIENPSNCKEIIIGFDLELQQFKEVPFPAIKRTRVNFNSRSLVAVGGYLCILDYYPESCMDVWLMKKSGAEWTWYKEFSVEQRGTFGYFSFLVPVAFSKSGKDMLLRVDGDHNAKLVWYNLDRKTVKNVRICGIPVQFNSFLYTESLLQLTDDKPQQQKPSKDKQDKNQKKRRDDFLSRGFKLRL